MSNTTDWRDILIEDTSIKPAMIRALCSHFDTEVVTLGAVADLKMSELKAMKGVGKIAIQSCMDAIGRAVRGEPAKVAGPSVLDVVQAAAA
jgi:hypothetical protein